MSDDESGSEYGYEEGMSANYLEYQKYDNFFYSRLPRNMKNRVNKLKHLLLDTVKINKEFYKKIYELEVEYKKKHDEIFNERKKVIDGDYEPTGPECQFGSDDENEETNANAVEPKSGDSVDDMAKNLKDNVNITEQGDKIKGLPGFWLKALQNVNGVREMMMDHDLPILAHLTDISYSYHDNDTAFTIKFDFSPNEYFTNESLTKTFYLSYEIPTENPISYSGPEICASQGCVIDWHKGKNVTVKQVKKVVKNRNRGEKKCVMKTVDNDSFFNFFNAKKQTIEEDYDEDFLDYDFKLGEFLRDSFIHRAVLHYTGEEAGSDLDEDDEDDESMSDEDLDSKDDENDSGKKRENQECKQQ